jgi:hypothetical protein
MFITDTIAKTKSNEAKCGVGFGARATHASMHKDMNKIEGPRRRVPCDFQDAEPEFDLSI